VEESILPYPASAGPSSLETFLSVAKPCALSYPSLSTTIIRRPLFDPIAHLLPDVFEKIVTPYDANAFDRLLQKHKLDRVYPELTFNLRQGFPLGKMPALTQTTIIPNHMSVSLYPDEVASYLKTEVDAGRMSGPFSKEEIERTLRGPFQSSPLIVAVQPQAPGEPDKLRICRHLSKSSRDGPAVNSFISKEDFPTRFDTACRVAEMVSAYDPYHHPRGSPLHRVPNDWHSNKIYHLPYDWRISDETQRAVIIICPSIGYPYTQRCRRVRDV